MRAGLASAVRERAHAGIPVVGICGGYQMLGEEISDPDSVEAPQGRVRGLGLLPASTVSNLLLEVLGGEEVRTRKKKVAELQVMEAVDSLIAWWKNVKMPLIVVTNEVGMSLVPPSRLSPLFTELLGRANQRLATTATRVYLVVAGLPIEIKALARNPS